MAADDPEIHLRPLGLDEDRLKGPPTALIRHRGVELILRFAPGDKFYEGDVQELRLLPGERALEPRTLRQIAPEADLYLAYVRAAIGTLKPDEKKTKQERLDEFHRSAQALHSLGGPGRGLPPEFFRQIALEHAAIVNGGEPHPIKTIAERHVVTISAASKWVKRATDLGYMKEAKTDAS